MPEQSRSTAELIVECLENEGVTHVFGIPGEENIRLIEALSKSSIDYVLTRHEQGASFMAETYGRLTGKAGVCSATLGPGAINLLLGTADATTNSTPLVALSAQVGMDRSYKESHQSVDLVSMFAPVTKWSALMATPGAAPEMIRKAFKLAQTERPGAVYLAVPEDVEEAAAPPALAPLRVNVPRPDDPSAEQVSRAAQILREARNPIVLAGHGAARADASAALIRFAQALNIPVATTFHGKGVFPDDHPLALGSVGFMRHDYVNFGFDRADVIVAVGYELQEFNPVRINPNGHHQDHPRAPVPGRGRRALRRRRRPHRRHQPQPRRPRRGGLAQGARSRRGADQGAAGGRARPRPAGRPVPAARRPASWPTPGPPSAARTSCWSTPAR